jgi:hypothetical protein
MQQLSQQLRDIDEARREIALVFTALEKGPDDVAASLLARIRFGEHISDIAESLPRAPQE